MTSVRETIYKTEWMPANPIINRNQKQTKPAGPSPVSTVTVPEPSPDTRQRTERKDGDEPDDRGGGRGGGLLLSFFFTLDQDGF